MDCVVHRVPKSWTRLSDLHFTDTGLELTLMPEAEKESPWSPHQRKRFWESGSKWNPTSSWFIVGPHVPPSGPFPDPGLSCDTQCKLTTIHSVAQARNLGITHDFFLAFYPTRKELPSPINTISIPSTTTSVQELTAHLVQQRFIQFLSLLDSPFLIQFLHQPKRSF